MSKINFRKYGWKWSKNQVENVILKKFKRKNLFKFLIHKYLLGHTYFVGFDYSEGKDFSASVIIRTDRLGNRTVESIDQLNYINIS